MSVSANAQFYKTEVEGLNAEAWADKIITDGAAIFSAEYEELGPEYQTYKILTQIVWGNPDPETQKSLIAEYRAIAEKTGERRHLLNVQMIDEILGGSRDLSYFIENGDWFTDMIAHWVDANFYNQGKLKFQELANYYGPIVEANSDDPAYPVAMYMYTDLQRSSAAALGELASYSRLVRENYYWMKSLYPDYNVRFVFDFDLLIMHIHTFDDASSLKLMEHIDSFDVVSHSPGNYLAIALTRAHLMLNHGRLEDAYQTSTETMERFIDAKTCGDYCTRQRALTALTAAATDRRQEAETILNGIQSTGTLSGPETNMFVTSAQAILDMRNPTEKDISNWIQASKNHFPRQRYILINEFNNPAMRFTPPKPEPPKPNPIFMMLSLLFGAIAIGAITALILRSRQLSEVEARQNDAEKRTIILEQHLNEVYSVTELSSNHTRNSLLSLERNIDNPRILEIVDIVSNAVSKWSGELSNLVLSAKNLLSGDLERTEPIEYADYEQSARGRWETMARLAKSSLDFQTKSVPIRFKANRMLMDIVVDMFVQNAFSRNEHDVVSVDFTAQKDRTFLEARIRDNGTRPTKFSSNVVTKGNDKSEISRIAQALKALEDMGGHFEQTIGDNKTPHEVIFYIPMADAEDQLLAANSN